jgi:hypothetical protein
MACSESRRASLKTQLAYLLHRLLSRALGHFILGSRNGSESFFARIFPLPISFAESVSGLGSGGNPRRYSHLSVSSASQALGYTHAHGLIYGIGGESRSSVELVHGRIPQPSPPPDTGAVHLGDTSDMDGSEGALNNPESHTLSLPVVGGFAPYCLAELGSLGPGVRARTLESDQERSSVSVLIVVLRGGGVTAAVTAAMSARARSGDRTTRDHF